MTLVQLGFHVGAHVDAVDRQIADESRDLDVEQPRVTDPHVREVHAVESGTTEVRFDEPCVAVVRHAHRVTRRRARRSAPVRHRRPARPTVRDCPTPGTARRGTDPGARGLPPDRGDRASPPTRFRRDALTQAWMSAILPGQLGPDPQEDRAQEVERCLRPRVRATQAILLCGRPAARLDEADAPPTTCTS